MAFRIKANAPRQGRRALHATTRHLLALTLILSSSTALAQSASSTSTRNASSTSSQASSQASTRTTTSGNATTTGNTGLRQTTGTNTTTTTSTTTADGTDPTALDPNADPNAADPTTTAAIRDADGELIEDNSDLGRQNLRNTRLDEVPRRRPEETETPGIPVGTFTLRPSISQTINTERSSSAGTSEQRTYGETGLKGTLTSDWSRHQLTITGEGIYQRNFSGDAATKPGASLDAELRLDLADETTATITGGYDFSREDTDDPNAIAGATRQSGIHRFTGGLALERDLGILRGLVAVEGERAQHSDVTLSDGTVVSLKDRDRVSGTLRGRIGYEISPALVPFLEASIGRVEYDRPRDTAGYARSADVYGGKAGVTVDLGEKLRGEMGLGYRRQVFEDSRLEDLQAVAAEGTLNWSPQRGTDVALGVSTALEPSTTAGENGYVSRTLTAALTHQLRSDLVGRLSGSVRWNDFSGTSDPSDYTVYNAGAGLSYAINRYLDLTADLGYETTTRKTGADTQVLRAGVGITAKR